MMITFHYWFLIFCMDACIWSVPIIAPGGYRTSAQCEQAIIEAGLTEQENTPRCIPSKLPRAQ